jgi:hypothetical protein
VEAVDWLRFWLIVVAALTGAALHGWNWIRWYEGNADIERDAGWHRMWHERIWDDSEHRD